MAGTESGKYQIPNKLVTLNQAKKALNPRFQALNIAEYVIARYEVPWQSLLAKAKVFYQGDCFLPIESGFAMMYKVMKAAAF